MKFEVSPSSLAKSLTTIQAELLVTTPAGVGWAPDFKKAMALNVSTDSEGVLAVSPTSVKALQCQLETSLNKGLSFEPNRMDWQFFIRGTIPSDGDKRAAILIASDVTINVQLKSQP